MREWRSHTTQSMHHSLEERTHRLNTMSAIYRQISEIIQGAVRGLSPGMEGAIERLSDEYAVKVKALYMENNGMDRTKVESLPP